VENVERVVAMLAEAGIETSVTNRRSWGGSSYQRASYSAKQNPESWPQVWIVKAEDQPRARQLMREAGIEPAVRHAQELALSRRGADAKPGYSRWAPYIRLCLIATIVLIVLLRSFGVF